jgi:hypothetical protein
VDDFGFLLQEQLYDIDCIFRIVNSAAFGFSMPSQVDNFTADVMTKHKLPESGEVNFDATVRRRKGSQQKHSQFSLSSPVAHLTRG